MARLPGGAAGSGYASNVIGTRYLTRSWPSLLEALLRWTSRDDRQPRRGRPEHGLPDWQRRPDSRFLGASLLVFFGIATKQISQFIYLTVDLPALLCRGDDRRRFPRRSITRIRRWPAWADRQRLLRIKPWHLALVTLIAIAAAIGPVYHGFALSMDEHMTRFQAAIFRAGHLAGEVPPAWRFVGRALYNSYAVFDGQSGHVYSFWRPGMAALYALFDLVGLGRYTSAVMSAGSVILVASVARLLWPRSDSAPLVAALLVATSQQVLFTGLTAYAMPAAALL